MLALLEILTSSPWDKLTVGLVSSGLSLFVGFVGSRYLVEWKASDAELVEKLENGHLGRRGRRRLALVAAEELTRWHRQLMPPSAGKKLSDWRTGSRTIVASDLFAGRGVSRCPRSYGNGPNLAPNSGPLYFALHCLATEGRISSLVEDLKKQLDAVSEDQRTPRSLFKCRDDEDSLPVAVWLNASSIRISGPEEAFELLRNLELELLRHFSSVSLVLEINLSLDVSQALTRKCDDWKIGFVPGSGELDFSKVNAGNSLPFESARYAVSRSLILSRLKSGMVLDFLRPPGDHLVGSKILDARLESHIDLSEPPQFLSIFGPPGSGKTELARRFLAKLVASNSSAAFLFSSEDSLELLAFLLGATSSSEAPVRLTEGLLKVIPSPSSGDSNWSDGLVDGLTNYLRSNPGKINILVDDILCNESIHGILNSIDRGIGTQQPRIVLVGRPRLRWKVGLKVDELRSELFTEPEAEYIVSGWNRVQESDSVTQLLKTDLWKRGKKRFSTYFLRSVFQSTLHDGPNSEEIHDPAKQMQEHLVRLVSPLPRDFSFTGRRPSDVLRHVRKSIADGGELDDIRRILGTTGVIDYVDLLGRISWHSRYEARSHSPSISESGVLLEAQRLVIWSGNKISTEIEANEFIDYCAKAGIFRKVSGKGATWIDNFVSDGFAARYIARTMMVEQDGVDATEEEREIRRDRIDSTIASMLGMLHSVASLEILPFAIDSSQLARIIRALLLGRKDYMKVVDSLLKDDMVSGWLGNNDGALAEDIVGSLTQLVQTVDPIEIGPLGPIFNRMMKLSSRVAEFSVQVYGENSPNGHLALAGRAAGAPSLVAFLDEINLLKIPAITVAKVALWSASTKTDRINFRSYLSDRLDGSQQTNDYLKVWKNWCERPENMNALTQSVYDLADDFDHSDYGISSMLEIACSSLAGKSRISLELDQGRMIRGIRSLWARRRSKSAKTLTKWVGNFWFSEICSRNDQWTLSKRASFALQNDAQKPKKVNEILFLISKAKLLSLPSSKSLLSVGYKAMRDPELVSDGFPRGFKYSDPIRPGMLKCLDVNDKKDGDTNRDTHSPRDVLEHEVAKCRFRWRAKMDLT